MTTSLTINSKLPATGTNIFTEMNTVSMQYDTVNLGQGFPDYPMDEHLIHLVNEAMKKGYNQYAHTNGYLPLREIIAEKIKSLYEAEINPQSYITVTPGGTYAIYAAITCCINKGDEVIIFEPAYDSYTPNIEVNGGKVVRVPLQLPGFSIDFEALKKAITPKTAMIILNSPHNPSGAVMSANHMQQLELMLQGSNILVVSDEVYEHICFNGRQHESVLKYPGLAERSFACFSFGKTFNCTGWKTGYCVAPPNLMAEFRKVHQFNAFSCFSPVQPALAEYLKEPQHYLQLSVQLNAKQKIFEEGMLQSRFRAIDSFGSYFQLFDYSDISDEPALEFAKRLVKEQGVTSIPVSAFYNETNDVKMLRFCFAKKEETLYKALERLVKA